MDRTLHSHQSHTTVSQRSDDRIEAWRKAVLRECMAIGAATGVVVRFSQTDDVSSAGISGSSSMPIT